MIVECDVLFDGEQVHPHARVIIDQDRITAVETQQESAPANGTPLRCRFAMPGLIDSHAHAFGYKESPPGIAPFGPHENVLRLMLYAGVTTVRDMGNSLEALRFLQHWTTEAGGPRLYSVGPVLDDLPLAVLVARLVRTEEDACREVDQLVCAGAFAIKAHRHVAPSLLAAIVSAAHRKDRRVAVQLGATTALQAIDAGVDNIEHLIDLLDPQKAALISLTPTEKAILWSQTDLQAAPLNTLIDKLAERGVVVCPTLIATRHAILLDEVVTDPYLDYMLPILPYHRHLKGMRNPIGYTVGKRYMAHYLAFPSLTKTTRREAEAGLERLQTLLALLHHRGVHLVVGTESPTSGVTPGFSMPQEMQLWVQSGVPSLDVLKAATARAADAMGLSHLGRIRPGTAADMLLLDRDPRDEMMALESPGKQVICRGNLVDRARLKAEMVAKIGQVTQ
jgi:imidazolonepropionase-like amidohydrolase